MTTNAKLAQYLVKRDTEILTWEDAIVAAHEEIRKCERRIARLRNSVKIARRMIRQGESFDTPTQNLGKKQCLTSASPKARSGTKSSGDGL